MAAFTTTGIEDLELSFAEISKLPDDVLFNMLNAEVEVVKRAQKTTAPKKTGKMANSIDANKPVRGHDGASVDVYPQGEHHKYKDRRTGATRSASNAEVGFIHEYGTSDGRVRAQAWMLRANEQSADEAVDKAMKVYDNFLKSKNL